LHAGDGFPNLMLASDDNFYVEAYGAILRLRTDADIYFTSSTDNGSAWSAPAVLNDDSTARDQFMPTIAVTPDGSHVFASWYDRRSDPNNSLIERWGVTGNIIGGAILWGPNFRLSSGSFPVVIGQDPARTRADYMGDYDQAVADNNFFYTTWGDNRLPDAAHAHQPDVRFAKIPISGPITPPTVLAPAASRITGTAATLEGQANPNGAATTARFEYGLTTSYGTPTPVQDLGTGILFVSILGGGATGLTCGTLYHFRAVAWNVGGTTNGADSTFTTGSCLPPGLRCVFTDDPLTPGFTVIKTVHITELRQCIDALRARVGLPSFNWSDPTLTASATLIRARHILDLRVALAELYSLLRWSGPTYIDPDLGIGTPAKGAHIQQIRQAIVALQ
jgi:hypothetical protein